MSEDEINHPGHYTSHPSGVECIEIAEHWTFNLGNALKYIWRAGRKTPDDPLKDLKKARWYIEREIIRLSKAESYGQEDTPEEQRETTATTADGSRTAPGIAPAGYHQSGGGQASYAMLGHR